MREDNGVVSPGESVERRGWEGLGPLSTLLSLRQERSSRTETTSKAPPSTLQTGQNRPLSQELAPSQILTDRLLSDALLLHPPGYCPLTVISKVCPPVLKCHLM